MFHFSPHKFTQIGAPPATGSAGVRCHTLYIYNVHIDNENTGYRLWTAGAKSATSATVQLGRIVK